MNRHKSYQEHFDERGQAYDKAMRAYPVAREQEFQQAIEAAQLLPGMVVADVPAGGGYLKGFLPSGCQWWGHEPCATFSNHSTPSASDLPLLPLPRNDGSIDAVISLAGLHHLDDKVALFREFFRVVRHGGCAVVSDVATDSPVAHFLDEFVGAHNSTGHEGVFLSDQTAHELSMAGWCVRHSQVQDFHWVFNDRLAMASFCHGLFDLRTATLDETGEAIERYLGVCEFPNGLVGMNWSLLTISAVKPA